MLGALAWQVNHSNKKFFCCLGERSHGEFFWKPQVLSPCACASLSFFFLYILSTDPPDCDTTYTITCVDDGTLAFEAPELLF
jgi:hypothetical protein